MHKVRPAILIMDEATTSSKESPTNESLIGRCNINGSGRSSRKWNFLPRQRHGGRVLVVVVGQPDDELIGAVRQPTRHTRTHTRNASE